MMYCGMTAAALSTALLLKAGCVGEGSSKIQLEHNEVIVGQAMRDDYTDTDATRVDSGAMTNSKISSCFLQQ